jgi:eukaryotic-like serine/threonine-protein kinase
MRCTSCQFENSADAVNCSNCGAALVQSASDVTIGHGEDHTIVGGLGNEQAATPRSRGLTAVSFASPPVQTPRPASISQALAAGGELGTRYVLNSMLGQGGMGRVYKAYDKELQRVVAIKVLQPELTANEEATTRFKQELLLASKVSHKNILRIHDLGEADGVKFITMAFVDGTDLHRLIREQGKLPVERALNIARQLCEALQAAHTEDVIHRDLKPQNILIGPGDMVYISDFGLAKSVESSLSGMTRSGALLGTPHYMAPEQAEGKPADKRSDIYALGLILYEMVTGDLPFKGDSMLQVLFARVKEKPKEPKHLNPEIPDYLDRIIMKCLERNPETRYQSAAEILSDLQAARKPTSTRTVQIELPVGSKKTWALAVGALVIVLSGLLAVPGLRHAIFRSGETGGGGSLTASGVPPLSQGQYLAVVPFKVIGDPNAVRYIADGVSEAISAKLFHLPSIKLASASASQKVNPDDPLDKVARSLGANLVLHGTVQGAGDKIRIIAQLDDVADSKEMWTQEFSGVQADLFTLEDQMYTQVVNALKVNVSSDVMAEASAHPTENLAAYDLYLRGRNALRNQSDQRSVQSSIDYFQQALNKDPQFPLAYAGIADASLLMFRLTKDGIWTQKAQGAAQQAEQLNDKLPEIHLALGAVYVATGRDAEAVAEIQQALKLAPNSDDAYVQLGRAFNAGKQRKEAIAAFEKAVEINPYYWANQNALGNAYFNAGQLDKAFAAYAKVKELEPDNAVGWENTAAVLFQEGKYQDCIPLYQKAIQLAGHYYAYSNLGFAYFNLKQYTQAVDMFSKASQMTPDDPVMFANLADAYRWSGQKDKASATYDQAISLAFKQLQVNPRNADAMGLLALCYAKKGDAAQANDFIHRALTITPGNVNLLYYQAEVEDLAGHAEQAVSVLRQVFMAGYPPDSAVADPELANLQSRPDFQALIKEFTKKPGA